jgi:hypothetical protein
MTSMDIPRTWFLVLILVFFFRCECHPLLDFMFSVLMRRIHSDRLVRFVEMPLLFSPWPASWVCL